MSFSTNDQNTQNWDEYDYFIRRIPGRIYVSKAIEHKSPITQEISERRIIKKIIDKEHTQFERLNVSGHIVLRESEKGRDQVKVIVYGNHPDKLGLTIQRFRNDTGTPYNPDAFSFSQKEFEDLLNFLDIIKFIDFSNKSKFNIDQSDIGIKKVLVDVSDKEIIEAIKNYKGEKREQFLNLLRHQNITKEDLDILSGRKSGLNEFKNALNENWTEPQWQSFFEKNTWIFGYGLDYKFFSILQRESHLSGVDLSGKNDVISDFLMADKNFTIIVELKKPNTPLFESSQDRSESWRLSKDMTYSVSQILAQKAEWQIKSEKENFDKEGNLIRQRTYDPKTILIIGNSNQFAGDDKLSKIKGKTFELYRRNMKNIEIYTYDELYERAKFIVEHNSNLNNEKTELDLDIEEDLPF
ncbi:MAG TPA: Shedu immune nuclease family protein [Bacteroidales bacterium]